MVSTNEITSATQPDGKRRSHGFSASFTSSTTSATSVFQESADTHLFIDRCSLFTDCSNGTTQTETANSQNQITSISGSTTPTYDANGNMISDQSGNTLVYDAWNRLVEVKNASGTIIAQYTYNAMGSRVTESYPQGGTGIPAGEINYIYYDSQWQAIETRTNGTAASNVSSQMVWSAAYINAAILQDSYIAGVIQPNSRLYFLQDANWNTTAAVGLINVGWQVLQYYVYSPYGTITVLNEDGAGSTPIVNNLYKGMTLDPVTGLYYARNRNYSPTLGRWINQDPAGYINGANTYQFVMSNPVGNVDPWGLCNCHSVPATFPFTYPQIPVKDFFWNPPISTISLYQQIQQDQSLENYWLNNALTGPQNTYNWDQYNKYRRVVDNLQTQEANQIEQMLAQMEKPGRANEECMNWNAISNGSEGAAIALEFINAILESLAPLG